MKIYTKTGDQLQTNTIDQRVNKNDIIIEANGVLDEIQSTIMLAYHHVDDQNIKYILLDICKDLFTVGYDITSKKQIFSKEKVSNIENLIDEYQEKIGELTEFVIPGLTKPSSYIHLARTTTRRAERVIVSYALSYKTNPSVLQYINRISDLLFIIARYIEKSQS